MATAKKARTISKKTTSTNTPEQSAASASPNTNGQPRSNGSSTVVVNIDEAIRQRAYELYEQRGCQEGNAMEDWLRAEAEMRGQRSA